MKFVIYEEKQCGNCNGNGKTLRKDWQIIFDKVEKLAAHIENNSFANILNFTNDISDKVGLLSKERKTETKEDCPTCAGKGYLHIPVPLTSQIIEQIKAHDECPIPADM